MSKGTTAQQELHDRSSSGDENRFRFCALRGDPEYNLPEGQESLALCFLFPGRYINLPRALLLKNKMLTNRKGLLGGKLPSLLLHRISSLILQENYYCWLSRKCLPRLVEGGLDSSNLTIINLRCKVQGQSGIEYQGLTCIPPPQFIC